MEKWGQDCARLCLLPVCDRKPALCTVQLEDVWTGLWANHAPGPGGLIEDVGSTDGPQGRESFDKKYEDAESFSKQVALDLTCA